MTCNQLGGACERVFSGETFDALAAKSQQHGKEMYAANDGPHMSARIRPFFQVARNGRSSVSTPL